MATPTPVRAPRRDAAENRESILRAAAVELNVDPDASIEAIAASAGLSRRAFYGHFATREDLLGELLETGAARVAAALADLRQTEPRFRLAEISAELWSEVSGVRVMAQLAVHGPFAARVAAVLAPLRATLARTIASGVESGEFRADIPVPTLARLVEGAAVSVLDEATRSGMSEAEGRQLVMLVTLGTAGLSWREAEAVATDATLAAREVRS